MSENNLVEGMKFIEDDECRVEYGFAGGYLVSIKIDVRVDGFFPKCNTTNRKLFSRWLKWVNGQLFSSLMQIPTDDIDKKIPPEHLRELETESSISDTPVRGQIFTPGELPQSEMARMKNATMDPEQIKMIPCPACGKDVYIKKACCGAKSWHGVCNFCKTKVRQ